MKDMARSEGRLCDVPEWKIKAVRRAIRSAVSSGPLPTAKLRNAVRSHLSNDEKARLGSVRWHAIAVKMDLEAKGEIVRLPGQGRQHIALAVRRNT